MFKQLCFSELLPEQKESQEFLWGDNTLLQFYLNKLLNSQEENKFVYVWGVAGSGKTHLLQTICAQSTTSIYIPLSMADVLTPKSLENLEQQSIVAIDDIQYIHEQKDWEEGLFHLFNRVRDEKDSLLIITGNRPVYQLGLLLPDLVSRLQWGLNWHLKEPSEEQKLDILIHSATKKGFHLPPAVGLYLLTHYDRNLNHLMRILDVLDRASLEAQRNNISIPFVKETLKPILEGSVLTSI